MSVSTPLEVGKSPQRLTGTHGGQRQRPLPQQRGKQGAGQFAPMVLPQWGEISLRLTAVLVQPSKV